MTSDRHTPHPETAELRDKIAALDAELAKDFEAQFSVAPFLSRKIVSFQEIAVNKWGPMVVCRFGNACMSGEEAVSHRLSAVRGVAVSQKSLTDC